MDTAANDITTRDLRKFREHVSEYLLHSQHGEMSKMMITKFLEAVPENVGNQTYSPSYQGDGVMVKFFCKDGTYTFTVVDCRVISFDTPRTAYQAKSMGQFPMSPAYSSQTPLASLSSEREKFLQKYRDNPMYTVNVDAGGNVVIEGGVSYVGYITLNIPDLMEKVETRPVNGVMDPDHIARIIANTKK